MGSRIRGQATVLYSLGEQIVPKQASAVLDELQYAEAVEEGIKTDAQDERPQNRAE